MSPLLALVRALRPHQWTKNLFVLAPALFEHRLDQQKNLRALAAAAIFCLISSAIYLLNDVVDREADRLHPKKRLRPIASGQLGVAAALAAAAVLAGAGIAWAWFGLESRGVTVAAGIYLCIQTGYCLAFKRMVVVDVLCIASGFVLRMLAGGSAAFVEQSAWILVCTIFLSLLLALCKRRHEVVSLGEGAVGHRAILADYPEALLDQLIGAATSGTLVTYALYTVDERTVRTHGLFVDGRPSPVLAATIPFVIYGVFRYLFLVYRREGGGSPTATLTRDVPSLVNGAAYLVTVLALFAYFGR